MSKTLSVRELRERLGPILDEVARGEQVIVLRRGKPIVRLISENGSPPADLDAHPLRGSVLRVADDFDAPLDELWEALDR